MTYKYDSSSTESELVPGVIIPDDNSSGTGAWILQNAQSDLAKNAIINGDFNIWQAGTSFATGGSATWIADTYRYIAVGAMVHTVTRDTDVPTQAESGHKSNYSVKYDCTTADAAIAAGDICTLRHFIEGYNFAPFMGKTATLSFWVKGTKTGIHCVSFRNGVDRSYIVEFTINTTLTWEKKTITLTFSDSGGTWNYINGAGLYIDWHLAAGTNFHSTADTWNSDDGRATSNQVNACDHTDNNFWLSQVQFELGSVATDFEYRQFQDELAKCQRYWCKSYDYDVDPGTVDLNGQSHFYINNMANSDHEVRNTSSFPVSMRSTPTITTYDSVGASGKVSMIVGDGLNVTVSNIGFNSFRAGGTNGAASTGRQLLHHHTAAARL